MPIYSKALYNIPKSLKTNPLTSQQRHNKYDCEKCSFSDAIGRYDGKKKRSPSSLYPNCTGIKLLNNMKTDNKTLKKKLKQIKKLLLMKNEEVMQLRKQLLYTVGLAFQY